MKKPRPTFLPYLYFAYGANTNRESMAARCPQAEPVGVNKIAGHRLVFRGVADVQPRDGCNVHGVLWRITADCEESLDAFEGFPTFYEKAFGILRHPELGIVDVMWYVMASRKYQAPPFPAYEATLRAGYADFDLPASQIDNAIARAKRATPPIIIPGGRAYRPQSLAE